MAQMRRVSDGQFAFFRYALTTNNSIAAKNALQDICRLYRRGFRFTSEHLNELELLINGIVLLSKQDTKVVRWCLNALALVGRLETCGAYVELALKKHERDPEIQAAGVAALFRMYGGSAADLSVISTIHPTIWKLAALQNTAPSKLNLGEMKIDIYNSTAPVLRLALITVGLNKDIDNLFHPKHSNSQFVRLLGQHDDNIVQQYSVWSIIENRRLSISDLGIPLDQIEQRSPNVQAKLYQLVAEKETDFSTRLDIIASGARNPLSDAREGLAKGLLDNYFDGLEEVAVDWMREERDPRIRALLARHIALHAENCGPYEDLAFALFEEEQQLREHLLLGSEGKPLYGKLKGSPVRDLFNSAGLLYDPLRIPVIIPPPSECLAVVLFAASPLDEDRLRLEEEFREIGEHIKRIGGAAKIKIKFDYFPAAKAEDLISNLLGSEADVFHFSGHAWAEGLVFEDALGNAKDVDTESLGKILSAKNERLKCVVLNGCDTQRVAKELIKHVECVIATTGSIDDDSSIAFSRTFYQSLAAGVSYRKAFDLAVTAVRISASNREARKFSFIERVRD